MSALSSLKLVVAKRPMHLPPVALRRNKMLGRIKEQIELAQAQQEGRSYAPTKQRKVVDAETGESKVVAVPKRVKPWWFVADNGKLCVQLRYGAKVLALGGKGVTAVEVSASDQLVPVLQTLAGAIEAGELDAAMDAASGAVKAGFKK